MIVRADAIPETSKPNVRIKPTVFFISLVYRTFVDVSMEVLGKEALVL